MSSVCVRARLALNGDRRLRGDSRALDDVGKGAVVG